MTLQPGKYFAIVRQLPDPNDATTYYVQAEIRNAETDALIERINLTDRGSRRFSYKWQTYPNVPDDGLYISILTTVYTDSGYTLKSDSYGEEMQTYLVKNVSMHFGGGGTSVSYKQIRQIVQEEIGAKKTPSFDYAKLLNMIEKAVTRIVGSLGDKYTKLGSKIDELQAAVSAIEMPETDLSGLHAAIEGIRIPENDLAPVLEAISAIHIPETDLVPLINLMGKIVDQKDEILQSIKEGHRAEFEGKFKDFVSALPSFLGDAAKPKVEEAPAPIMSPLDVHAILRSKKK